MEDIPKIQDQNAKRGKKRTLWRKEVSQSTEYSWPNHVWRETFLVKSNQEIFTLNLIAYDSHSSNGDSFFLDFLEKNFFFFFFFPVTLPSLVSGKYEAFRMTCILWMDSQCLEGKRRHPCFPQVDNECQLELWRYRLHSFGNWRL